MVMVRVSNGIPGPGLFSGPFIKCYIRLFVIQNPVVATNRLDAQGAGVGFDRFSIAHWPGGPEQRPETPGISVKGSGSMSATTTKVRTVL